MCRGRRSDMERGSTSNGSQRTVQVRGYMRANGTFVPSYTRAWPGSGSKACAAKSTTTTQKYFSAQESYQLQPTNTSRGTSSGNVVHVGGYMRSNGTYVASHTRSAPGTKNSKKSAAVLPVPASLVPVTSTGGGAQAAESAHRHLKYLKYPHQQPLLDTTNTTTLSRRTPVVQQSKKQHSPPLAVYGGARRENCPTIAQTAVQGSISRVPHDSDEYSRVVEKFKKDWTCGLQLEQRRCPAVNFVFKVTNDMLERKWTAYKSTLREKQIEEVYHGTKLSCKITASWKCCDTGSCGICGISKSGFDRRFVREGIRFGTGFYLAPNSSKSHDYTQSYNGFKAMLLCDVLPGRKRVFQTNMPDLQSAPTGYDSVYHCGNVGRDLDYPELVVYKPEAVLPRYIIVYRCRD